MPANTTNQQITYPIGTDLADNPTAFTDMLADVEGRLVQRYTSNADRLARNPAPTAGELSLVAGNTWYDRYTGANWIPATAIQAVKTAAQVVNNSTALVNDIALAVALPAANTEYAIEGFLNYNSSTTADFKFALTAPAGSTARYMGLGVVVGGTTTGDGNYAVASTGGSLSFGGAGVGTDMGLTISGGVVTAGTTGFLTLQWAQNALDPTNTTVTIRSWLRATAIS